jgi:hypothetical protein
MQLELPPVQAGHQADVGERGKHKEQEVGVDDEN